MRARARARLRAEGGGQLALRAFHALQKPCQQLDGALAVQGGTLVGQRARGDRLQRALQVVRNVQQRLDKALTAQGV